MDNVRDDFGRVDGGKLIKAPRTLYAADGTGKLLHPTEEDYAAATPPYFPVIAGQRPADRPGYNVVLDHYEERTVDGKTSIVPVFDIVAIDPSDGSSVAAVLAQYDDAMERYLQFVRDERGYTSREPSDYALSQNQRWHQDALDWIAFRDDVMSYALGIMNEFKSSGRAVSVEDFIAGMPRITWTAEQCQKEGHTMLIGNRQSTCDAGLFDKYTRVFVATTSQYTKTGIGQARRADASRPLTIDWGDGSVDEFDGDATKAVHDYGVSGDFVVKLSNLSAFSLGYNDSGWRQTTSQVYYTAKSCVVGTTVKLILAYAFNTLQLSSIEFPNSVLSVGSYTFYSAGPISSIVIPDSVRYIESRTFFNANQTTLTSVIFPRNAYMPDTTLTFCDCKAMTKYRLPESITAINQDTFNKCFALKYVDIPPSVSSIHGLSFYRCTGLSCVNITSLSSWCGIQFIPYSSYGVDTMQPLNFAHGLHINGQLVTDLSIPYGIKQIYDYAFYNCYKSTSLEIPDTVSSIGKQAFYNCYGLSSLSLGNSITSIGYQAFYSCSKVSTLHLPDSLLSIGEYAFSYCSKIQNARIPNGCISSIGQQAFTNLTSLNDMLFCGCATDEISALPNYPWGIPANKLTAMYGGAAYAHVTYVDSTTARFKIAGELKANDIADLQHAANIVVDDGLISIAPSTFANCINLAYVDLPQTLNTIGQDAFTGCSGLQSLTLKKKVISEIQSMENYPWGIVDTSVIHGLQPTIAKFIDGTTSAYGVDVITQDLIQPANDVVEISVSEDVTDIYSYAFMNFSNLSNVTMNEGLTCIGNHAFANCGSLTSIDVPDGVVSAGTYVFASCFNLVSAQLPDTLVNIGMRMFYQDTALHHVRMPNHMSSLGVGTFMSCTGIISCEIPIGLTSIGTQTFGTCSSLTQTTIPYTVNKINTNAFIRCFSLSSLTCYALSAPTVAATTFGNTATTYAGLSVTRPKTLHVPTGATGYEESYWQSNLLNPAKCGFTISYEDALLDPFLTKIEFADGDLSSCDWSEKEKSLYDYMDGFYDGNNDTWAKWMTKIEIGNQFTTIQDGTFYELTTLTDVRIPYSVTSCEENAFAGCTGLTSIVVEGKTIDEAKKMLEGTGIPANCKITVV